MSEFDDPLAQIPEPEPLTRQQAEKKGQRSKTRKGDFDDPLMSELGKAQTAKATQSGSMRGQYWQRTLRLPPEYQDLTAEIHNAGRARSIADTERWIYAMGLYAYFVEGKRPSYTPSVARDIELPDFSKVQS